MTKVTEEQLRENLKTVILSEDDLQKIYGKGYLKMAKDMGFDLSEELLTPNKYRLFTECFLYYVYQNYGYEVYRNNLMVYNEHQKRVRNIHDTLIENTETYFSRKRLTGIYDFNYSEIKDGIALSFVKNKHREGYTFKREREMERTFVDQILSGSTRYNIVRQYKTKYGKCDIEVNDGTNSALIELKTEEAKRKDIYQIYDYWFSLNPTERLSTEKILIAFSFSEDVLELAELLNITCISYMCHTHGILGDVIMKLRKENDLKEYGSIIMDTLFNPERSGNSSVSMFVPQAFEIAFEEYIKKKIKEIKRSKKEEPRLIEFFMSSRNMFSELSELMKENK